MTDIIGSCSVSALDTSTERDIQKALQNLMTGRSSLSIAHRLSVWVLSMN
jgi:ABC-type transport system involved in Fe-S cluster assembly fused permease/ATPase subunit